MNLKDALTKQPPYDEPDDSGHDIRRAQVVDHWWIVPDTCAGIIRRFTWVHPDLVAALGEGHYCGYVLFPFGRRRDDLADVVDVHGGITWVEGDETWAAYGFDCAHAGDEDDPRCQDVAWVKAEVERMAAQIMEVC